MLISEKGLCKLLKAAKGKGYEIIPETHIIEGGYVRRTLAVNARNWAIKCATTELPAKAAVQLVEDAGYLPVEPITVRAGASNQLLIPEVVEDRSGVFAEAVEGEYRAATALPFIFKERWQLYRTEDGAIYGYDTELLELIDIESCRPEFYILDTQNSLCVGLGRAFAIIAAGRFSREDEAKIAHIAAFDWTAAQDTGDPAVNMSLFDDISEED